MANVWFEQEAKKVWLWIDTGALVPEPVMGFA